MVAALKAGLELDEPGKDGAPSLRQQWVERWEKTGTIPAALADEPEPPAAGEHVWRLFHELSAQRSGSGFGVNPIDATLIEAHCRLTRADVKPWEVAAIFAMDRAYLRHQSDSIKNADKPRMIPAEPETLARALRTMAGPKRKGGKKS